MTKHPLIHLIELQKSGQAVGIYSACTANPLVIRACLQKAKDTHSVLLVEATANQVDQYGGYTGMKPSDFITFVEDLAKKEQFDTKRIIFGGDHLGPLTFAHYDEEKAMEEAEELIRQYVLAGFTKIHIDTSMKVASDPKDIRLSDEIIANRGARLARVAEDAYKERCKKHPDSLHPVYVVGSEVPIPGGSQEAVDTGIQVTKVADFKNTVAIFKKSFPKESWPHVIAVVVQPGMEEKDAGCTDYDRTKAVDLMASIKEYSNIVFEGHSSDYQTRYNLRKLVEDGVGILKVGPGLTYAAREALFALAYAEKEVYKNHPEKQSYFMEILEEEMLKEPKYFQKHYHGTEDEIAYKRKFSFSDRSRYYLPKPAVQKAIDTLLTNFKDGVPYGVLSQFLPREYTSIRCGELKNDPLAIIKAHVGFTIDEYLYASHQEKLG